MWGKHGFCSGYFVREEGQSRGTGKPLRSTARPRLKAVGPVCCVMHVKEPRTLIVKEKGACPRCFWNGNKKRQKYLHLGVCFSR